jgi:hypothetical protein
MRCTECNREVLPVVAIDIDGTTGMYHKHFLEFASAYLNEHLAGDFYTGDEPFKQWFCRKFDCSYDTWHDIKLAYRQGGMKRTMPVYPGAASLSRQIMHRAELWVTTTRPYIRHDNVDPDTREWLRRNLIEYNYLIYDGHKYHKLADLVGRERVCAILEDLPEEIDEAKRLFGNGVAIHRITSYNASTARMPNVHSLADAWVTIKDRIERWEEAHAGDVNQRREASSHDHI